MTHKNIFSIYFVSKQQLVHLDFLGFVFIFGILTQRKADRVNWGQRPKSKSIMDGLHKNREGVCADWLRNGWGL